MEIVKIDIEPGFTVPGHVAALAGQDVVMLPETKVDCYSPEAVTGHVAVVPLDEPTTGPLMICARHLIACEASSLTAREMLDDFRPKNLEQEQ